MMRVWVRLRLGHHFQPGCSRQVSPTLRETAARGACDHPPRRVPAVFCLLLLLLWGRACPGTAAGSTVATLTLSLEDCVRQAVSQNLTILRKRLSPEEKRLGIEGARRVFVPVARGEVIGRQQPTTQLTYEQSLVQPLRDGSRVELGTKGSRKQGARITTEHTHTFTLTRPLLRHFGRQVAGYEVESAKIQYQIAVERFKADLNAFIVQLARLYLNLNLARANLAVQEQALVRAERQYADTKHDIEIGAIAPNEIYVVEENVLDFQIRLARTRHSIALLESALRNRLYLPVTAAPVLAMEVLTAPPLPVPDGVASDVVEVQNPALHVETLLLRRADLDLRVQRNRTRSRVDVHLDLRRREGTNLTTENSVLMGVEFETPLQRGPDRARTAQIRLLKSIQELSLDEVRHQLLYDLHETLLEINHQQQMQTARRRAVALSRQKLDAETEKYRNGFSTLADVVRFQRDLENAMVEELRVDNELAQAVLTFYQLEGTLFQKFAISLDATP